MLTMQEMQAPLDTEIVKILMRVIPPHWNYADLVITRSAKDDGLEGLAHEIQSPEGFRDIVVPPDSMFPLTIQLADVFRRHGRPLSRVKYSIRPAGDGDWHWSADYVT